MTHARTGVLLMAYGTPERLEEVEAYYTHIRGGRQPTADAVRRLRERYEAVGGRTPLLEVTNAVCTAVERELNASADKTRDYRVYAGMKHWHPFIGDVLPRIAADGVREVVALALAPHFSRLSIGAYRKAVEDAVERLGTPMNVRLSVRFVDSWHLHPSFIELVAQRIVGTLGEWPTSARPQVVTVFSAHSLPERIRDWDDPYEQQVLESCHAVAERAGIDIWRCAWQSAGHTGEPWLGPDILVVLEGLYRDGVRHVLSVPIGFVSDHLEVLYDVDREAAGRARSLGMTFRRTPMPNVSPEFIRLVADIVLETSTPSTVNLGVSP